MLSFAEILRERWRLRSPTREAGFQCKDSIPRQRDEMNRLSRRSALRAQKTVFLVLSVLFTGVAWERIPRLPKQAAKGSLK